MAVLDASFLIDLLRSHGPAVSMLDVLEENGDAQIVPAPALYEIAVELGRKRTSGARTRRVLASLESLLVHPFDEAIALEAGRLAGSLEDRGSSIDDIDCMIAATALRLDEPVVTANAKHFTRVPGLTVQAYR